MELTDKEKATIQYYDAHAGEWAAARLVDSKSIWTIDVGRFHELLPSGKVIEIGSGSGREAAQFLQLGYYYMGTDASEGLITIARRDNPTGTFLHQNVFDLDFPAGTFDGFWTAATLLHIPKSRIQKALKSIQRVVKPEGIGFISLKEGQGEEIDKATGRLFSYYSQDEFSDVLSSVNMAIIDVNHMVQKSTRTKWLKYFVRNSK